MKNYKNISLDNNKTKFTQNNSGFSVPPDYFNKFEAEIWDKIAAEEKQSLSPLKSKFRQLKPYLSIAASVLILISAFLIFKTKQVSDNKIALTNYYDSIDYTYLSIDENIIVEVLLEEETDTTSTIKDIQEILIADYIKADELISDNFEELAEEIPEVVNEKKDTTFSEHIISYLVEQDIYIDEIIADL